MRAIQELKNLTFTAAGNTADELKLSAILPSQGGMPNYVLGLVLRAVGSITAGAGVSTIDMGRLFSNILLEIPDLGVPLVNISGKKAARAYRVENSGNQPPSVNYPWGTGIGGAGAGAINFDLALPIEFNRAFAHDPIDTEIPAALLRLAKFKVTVADFASLVITGNAPTAMSFVLHPEVYTRVRDELVIPTLTTLDSVSMTGVQPPVSPVSGKYEAACIVADDDKIMATTDYTTLGLSVGAIRLSEDTQAVVSFYNAFNQRSQTDFTSHTATQSLTDSLPLVYPCDEVQGQHLTFGTLDARGEHRIKADVAANTVALVRRYAWDMDPVRPKIRAMLGLPPDTKARVRSATGKRVRNPDARRFLPAKVA